MKRAIDLNADLGEDDSAEGIARDIAIMDVVSSCNIACGGHAGSPETMRAMLIAAKAKNVAAGAHPSYPDRANFGRISMKISSDALKADLLEQLSAIMSIAADVGMDISHIKPHGALYNDAQDDDILAQMLVEIAQGESLPLVGMAGSAVDQEARAGKLPFLSEAFIDRQYTRRARLVPRSEKGAVIVEDSKRIQQGLALVQGNPVITSDGTPKIIPAETLCLHSDSDGALVTAKAMRHALELEGIVIAAPIR